MQSEQFEPVFLVPEGPAKLTEYGKRWMENRMRQLDRFAATIRDACKLATLERESWKQIERALIDSGVPTAITSGLSQYAMSHLIDHVNGKTSFTMPSTVAMAGMTSAPSSTTTGVIGTTETTNYTGYARQAIAGSGFNAATSATPSVSTNNGAITFPACTASTATWTGFVITDNSTINTGNALWYGTLASVVISTTQTPPTVATTVMSLSMTGT